jgi:RNA polymerase sigma-70 factor (ECF subfamily)
MTGDYQAGSKVDFDRLYEVTYPRLFGTVLAIVRDRAAAEDCVQEAFLRAYRRWSSWRGEAPAEAWIFRIAINVAISHRRAERLHEVGELIRRLGRPQPEDPTRLTDPDLLRELRALPPKQAVALILRHVHGYTNREIAFALGVPERTIASRLAGARAQLKVRLQPALLGTRRGHRVPTGD